MMINREMIKREIDKVDDKYLVKLYKIIKIFGEPDIVDCDMRKKGWGNFLDKYSGALAETPIERVE